MKAFVLPLLLTLASVTLATAAPIAKLTTLTGKTFRQCNILKVYPDGVAFRHTNGVARILFTDLSSDWRNRLGYSPKKAAAYKQELADKRAAEKAARAKYEEARFKLLAEAADRARIQALGQEAQARAFIAMQQQQNMFGNAAFAAPPVLGAVFNSAGVYNRYDRHRNYPYWQNGYGYGYNGYNNGYAYGVGYNGVRVSFGNGMGSTYSNNRNCAPGWGGGGAFCAPAAPACAAPVVVRSVVK